LSLKKTDATELKRDKSLQNFIEALPHLKPLHYGFNVQGSNQSASCMCSSAHGLNPWRTTNGIDTDYYLCGNNLFLSHGLLQHCDAKEDNHHKATTLYLRRLYAASRKKSAMPINSGIKHATAHHEKMLMINQKRQLMQTQKKLFVIITLSIAKNQTLSIK
jgi:hypothetical protein